MTLQHGKFYIDKARLISYLGLDENTHIEVNDEENGVEIYAVSDKENKHLIEKTSDNHMLRRTFVPLHQHRIELGKIYQIVDTNDNLEITGLLEVDSDEEAIKIVKETHSGKTLIKEEVIYYEKGVE